MVILFFRSKKSILSVLFPHVALIVSPLFLYKSAEKPAWLVSSPPGISRLLLHSTFPLLLSFPPAPSLSLEDPTGLLKSTLLQFLPFHFIIHAAAVVTIIKMKIWPHLIHQLPISHRNVLMHRTQRFSLPTASPTYYYYPNLHRHHLVLSSLSPPYFGWANLFAGPRIKHVLSHLYIFAHTFFFFWQVQVIP